MTTEMTTEPTKQDLEKLVEAQARGEPVEAVPTEEQKPQEAELDTRVSRDAGIIWGERK